MRHAMNFEANQTNLLHAWELETQRLNHLRRLNTIYRDKNAKHHSFYETQGMSYAELHQKNKERDLQRRQKSAQHQIDYENEILRTKLIEAALPKHLKSRPNHPQDKTHEPSNNSVRGEKRSFTQKKHNYKSESYIMKQEKHKIAEENAKLFVKLAAIKSELGDRLNIKDHQKKVEQIKEKLEKRSPKKMRMMRSFFKKRNLQYGEILLPSAAKYMHSIENEEEQP